MLKPLSPSDIVRIKENLYVVDRADTEIQQGEYYYSLVRENIIKHEEVFREKHPYSRKIIATVQATERLNGIINIELPDEDERLAKELLMQQSTYLIQKVNLSKDSFSIWKEGIKAAKSKGVFSEEGMRKAIEWAREGRMKSYSIEHPEYYFDYEIDDIIHTLSKLAPKEISELVVEAEEYMTEGWMPTYNNPDNNNFEISAEIDYRLKVHRPDSFGGTNIAVSVKYS